MTRPSPVTCTRTKVCGSGFACANERTGPVSPLSVGVHSYHHVASAAITTNVTASVAARVCVADCVDVAVGV